MSAKINVQPFALKTKMPNSKHTSLEQPLDRMRNSSVVVDGGDQRRAKFIIDTFGPTALSDENLIEILLEGQRDPVEIEREAKECLAKLGGISAAIFNPSQPPKLLKTADDLTSLKLIAINEVLRRSRLAKLSQTPLVESHDDAVEYLRHMMAGKQNEEVWALYLNSSLRLVHQEQIGRGGVGSAAFDVRQICRSCFEHHATSCLLSHNHTNNQPKPSDLDILETKRLKSILLPLEIDLADHIIICDDSQFSFKWNGIL